jgi:Glycosyltransferase family 87
MSSVEDSLLLPRRPALLAALARFVRTPRFAVYLCCSVLVLLISYELGKDMAWDTLDYHFYAGFSALHDRFAQDYFPAGPQSYLNPYVYVPFYLLVTSGLTALQVAVIFAAVQSVILWLVYELALVVAPPLKPQARVALGVCAVGLACANPVLITEFGSSFADLVTAELVVAGWLLLVGAIRTPGAMRVACAALLLGCAGALKLTNALHAISAGVLLLFMPGNWRSRLRYAAVFCLAGAVGFAVVAAPWAIRLAQHFGNPFFPLFNAIFRSPDFTTARIIDYRFIPISLGSALWRPFAMISADAMVHVEWAAPDLRYAVLLLAMAFALVAWAWRAGHRSTASSSGLSSDGAARSRVALGLAFIVDWSLWLSASGNSRYFIPMACVAAVLAVALIFQLCAQWPKVGNYLLLVIFGVQLVQLHMGAEYPARTGWRDEPWFHVSVPRGLATEPALYFNIGVASDSFIAPYLAPGSGLVNLEGDYTLGPQGASGRHIESLIRRYSPHLRVLVRDTRRGGNHNASFPDPVIVSLQDALDPFGLQMDTSNCASIVVRGITTPVLTTYDGSMPPKVSPSDADTGHFVSCGVVPETRRDPAVIAGEGPANLVLDRLEDACPALLQPRRQVTFLLGGKAHGYAWARQYVNTDMSAWVTRGWVHFQRFSGGGKEGYAGQESTWEKAPQRVSCGRGPDGYFLRVQGPR